MRRLFGASAEALIIVILVFGLLAVPVFAAKGGGQGGGGKPSGGGTGTISLATLVYDANADGLPNWGDTVTFDISQTATTQPFVNLKCYQDGVLVASGSQGYFDGALNSSRDFGLSAGTWQGGAAECTAWLDMYTRQGWSHLGSTAFHVSE